SCRARFLAYLGDAEHQRDLRRRARDRYREALALDPQDVDWEEIRDDEVRALPDIARTEFELEDGVAWSAPVGIILGVLPRGHAPVALPSDGAEAGPQNGSGSMDPAQRFLAALVQDRREPGQPLGGAVIDARRTMRTLAPQLLAAYLEG